LSEGGAPNAASLRPGSLWAYALDLYGRPGVEARLLQLQDEHRQNACLLIWSLWMAAEGRAADAATLAAGAAMARSWDAAAVEPLRRLRRDLKRASAGPARRRERLREGVRALELKAERMLLEMLQDASPAAGPGPLPAADALASAAGAWGAPPPANLLHDLAAAAA